MLANRLLSGKCFSQQLPKIKVSHALKYQILVGSDLLTVAMCLPVYLHHWKCHTWHITCALILEQVDLNPIKYL